PSASKLSLLGVRFSGAGSVQRALAHNASAVLMAHNHPSGSLQPSASDRAVTARLKAALDTVDVRLLDHFVVTSHEVVSMASQGMV
ncbi:JAB domain-containing protein, partial [Stenotrophomonas maltophilia]|uniref:JAB domain-containing protein n=1 Tax=Stenotrophomonas maltophilia TaxID=40324 RepID=UPI0039C13E36